MSNEWHIVRPARRRRFRVGVPFLAAALVSFVACSSDMKDESHPPLQPGTNTVSDRVAGEYIVTVQPGSDAALLRQLYAAYGVRELSDLGANHFLVKLNRDPGLDEIRRTGLDSGKVTAVQPNFVYRGLRR